jgi:hypothetical protein
VGWGHWGNGYATEAASGAIARGLAAGLPERYYGTALEVFSAVPDVRDPLGQTGTARCMKSRRTCWKWARSSCWGE